MKKILAALCGLMVVGLCACGGDDNHGRQGDDPQRSQGEGVYHPGAKIEAVLVQDEPTEVWGWSEENLMFVGEPDYCGGYEERLVFAYDGDRVSEVAMPADSLTMRVDYSGDYISSLSLLYDGQQGGLVRVTHNEAHKVSHLDVEVDEALVQQLVNRLLADEELFARHPLAQLVGVPAARAIARVAALNHRISTKLSLSEVAIGIDFDWNGDNVARVYVSADVSAAVTMAEVAQVVDLEEYFGSLAGTVAGLPGEHPLALSVRDTLAYTYDHMSNPLQGFLGRVDVAVLSANNVLTMDSYGTANVTLALSLPIVGEYPVSRSFPLNDMQSLTYTYTEAGYPLTVTAGDGEETKYEYKE